MINLITTLFLERQKQKQKKKKIQNELIALVFFSTNKLGQLIHYFPQKKKIIYFCGQNFLSYSNG